MTYGNYPLSHALIVLKTFDLPVFIVGFRLPKGSKIFRQVTRLIITTKMCNNSNYLRFFRSSSVVSIKVD